MSFIFKAFVVMKWPLFDLKVAMKLNRPYNAIGISANKLGSKVSSSSDINLQCQSIIFLRTGDLTRCVAPYIRILNQNLDNRNIRFLSLDDLGSQT